MSERLTILEVHLGDSTIQFGPRTLGGDETNDEDERSDDEGAEGGKRRPSLRSIGRLLLIVGLLAALGTVAKNRFGAPDLDATDELDDLVN